MSISLDGIVQDFDAKRWNEDLKTDFNLRLYSGKLFACSSPRQVMPVPPVNGKLTRVAGDWFHDPAGRLLSVRHYEALE